MAEIVQFPGITRLDIDTANMLRNIADSEPAFAFVITWPEDGSMPEYFCNTSDTPIVLMRLQQFIHKYYNGDFSG